MTPEISFLLADVDGTLVTEDKILTPRARDAVMRLNSKGIRFAITSGRPPRGMSMFVDPLALTDAQGRDDAARIELELVGLEHPVELGEELTRRQARVQAKGDIFQDRHRLE